jgi:hypothetical protein
VGFKLLPLGDVSLTRQPEQRRCEPVSPVQSRSGMLRALSTLVGLRRTTHTGSDATTPLPTGSRVHTVDAMTSEPDQTDVPTTSQIAEDLAAGVAALGNGEDGAVARLTEELSHAVVALAGRVERLEADARKLASGGDAG